MKEAQAKQGFENLISNQVNLETSRLKVREAVVLMFPWADLKVRPLVQMLAQPLFRRQKGMTSCVIQVDMG